MRDRPCTPLPDQPTIELRPVAATAGVTDAHPLRVLARALLRQAIADIERERAEDIEAEVKTE